MSKIRNVKIKCPKCGKELDAKIYESINVSLDKDLLDKVCDFSVFRLKCEDCRIDFPLEYDCMFHDMENKVVVWSINSVKDRYKAFEEGGFFIDQGYSMRFVESNKDLVEKVNMLRDGFCDTVIEYIKVHIIGELIREDKSINLDLDCMKYFKYIEEEKMLDFVVLLPENKMQHIYVPHDEYDNITKIVPKEIYDTHDIKSTIVNTVSVAEWMKNNIKNNGCR